jgi:hypothetical protein
MTMAHWQASITKAPPKSKAELRQMLTEAVRNTQAEADQRPKHQAKSKSDQPQV